MTNNRDRIKYLRIKLNHISNEIQRRHLQDQYISLQRDIVQGSRTISPVDDALWETMLPKEQDENLLAYYHTLRVELLDMMRELGQQEKKSKEDKLRWLDDKWTARVLTVGGLVELAVTIYQTGQYVGLWFDEED